MILKVSIDFEYIRIYYIELCIYFIRFRLDLLDDKLYCRGEKYNIYRHYYCIVYCNQLFEYQVFRHHFYKSSRKSLIKLFIKRLHFPANTRLSLGVDSTSFECFWRQVENNVVCSPGFCQYSRPSRWKLQYTAILLFLYQVFIDIMLFINTMTCCFWLDDSRNVVIGNRI